VLLAEESGLDHADDLGQSRAGSGSIYAGFDGCGKGTRKVYVRVDLSSWLQKCSVFVPTVREKAPSPPKVNHRRETSDWSSWNQQKWEIVADWKNATRDVLRLLQGRARQPTSIAGPSPEDRRTKLVDAAWLLAIDLPEESAAIDSFVAKGKPDLERTLVLIRERNLLNSISNFTSWRQHLTSEQHFTLLEPERNNSWDLPLSHPDLQYARHEAILAAVSSYAGPTQLIPPTLRTYSQRALGDRSLTDFEDPDYNALISFARDPDVEELSFGFELTFEEVQRVQVLCEKLGLVYLMETRQAGLEKEGKRMSIHKRSAGPRAKKGRKMRLLCGRNGKG